MGTLGWAKNGYWFAPLIWGSDLATTTVAGNPTWGGSVTVLGYHQSWTSPVLESVWIE